VANRDEPLFRAMQNGNGQALAELYDRYSSVVYAFALRTCLNQECAEEVTQDTFVRLWTTTSVFDPKRSHFQTWLLTIARRLCQDQLRKKRRFERTVARHTEDGRETPLGSLEHGSDVTAVTVEVSWFRQEVLSSLQGLTTEERKVIELAYFYGFTLREVAEQLQRPLGTVKTRLNHALTVLRQDLQGWKGGFRA